LRRYDIIFIVPVDLPEDEISAMCERYGTFITDHQGIVVKIDRWGKRKLAYEIKKQRRGYYLLFDVVSDHAAITEIERNFKIDERILKYLTVRRDGTFTREAIEKEIADAAKKAEEGDAGKQPAEPIAPKMVIPAAAAQETAAKTVDEGVK
jgi:small subunit ribosomal protein S6